MMRVPVFLALALLAGACAPDQPPSAPDGRPPVAAPATGDSCSLTMGWDPWEPYHYRDVGGQVHGLDIELVSAIANAAGCSIDFDQEDWATLLGRLRDGEIDILSGATRTAAREQFAWFSEPYREEEFRLYVRSGEAGKFSGDSLEALVAAGMTVGTTLEYVYGPEVDDLQDDERYAANFSGAAFGELNVGRLLDFEIDGFLEDLFVAATIIRKRGLEDTIEAHPLAVSSGPVHLMFSRKSLDSATVQRLNEGLARIRASGEYQRIVDRYL